MATDQEIEQLKNNWLADPCFDLYDAEGFEAHRDELKTFQDAKENEWDRRRVQALLAKADQLGCPGNAQLASYVLALEKRLSVVEALLAI